MSSTNVSRLRASTAACRTSSTASGMSMKYRRISGCVTVTGPPARICSSIRGNHAAVAAQHIAESDGDEPSLAVRADRLHDQFGNPLGRSHHAGRVGRLVSGDEDEALHSVATGGIRNRSSAGDIVLDGLARVRFHERADACERRHERRAAAGARRTPIRLDSASVTSPMAAQIGSRSGPIGQIVRDGVQAVLVPLEQHQARRRQGGDLAAQLRTNRSARARHEHPLASHQLPHVVDIERDRASRQQVFDRQGADLLDRDSSRSPVPSGRAAW